MQARFDISPDEAIALLVAAGRMAGAAQDRSERVPVGSARGRVLLEDLRSRADRPTHDDSALDGFACRSSDTTSATVADPVTLSLVGASVAGAPFGGSVSPGRAVAIATGALVPDGADAVIGVEHATVVGGAVSGGEMYGRFPTVAMGGPDDATGRGVWVPTTSVDQYAATFASWLGMDQAGLAGIFPNLANFPQQKLAFLG